MIYRSVMYCVAACCSAQVVFWLGVAINLIMSFDYLLRLYDPRCRIYRLPAVPIRVLGTRSTHLSVAIDFSSAPYL